MFVADQRRAGADAGAGTFLLQSGPLCAGRRQRLQSQTASGAAAGRAQEWSSFCIAQSLPHSAYQAATPAVTAPIHPHKEQKSRFNLVAHAFTTFSAASRSRTAAADSVGLTPVVSSVTSGLLGASYGAETPVKSSISPANAAA